ncbi:hypothetical protein DWU98_11305 [Dyella monticola]|uniref:LysR substrate-binding domain-containing protein n=1 Tax=Dyella monticola TaxID=1927958 RepID=A0A370WYQ3_9GAMM|nr:hypothetical protein DWU98_11305 [Dyella monticola]
MRIGEKLEKDMIALPVGPDLRMAVVASPAYLAKYGTPQAPQDLSTSLRELPHDGKWSNLCVGVRKEPTPIRYSSHRTSYVQ